MSETFLIVLGYIALSCLVILGVTVTVSLVAVIVQDFRRK